jgi:RTA1 like protein
LPLISLKLADLAQYRIVFRIVEFSAPQGSSISVHIENHEWFVYVFDALPMLLAILLFNIWHPGKVLRDNANKGYAGMTGRDSVPLQPQAYGGAASYAPGAPVYNVQGVPQLVGNPHRANGAVYGPPGY